MLSVDERSHFLAKTPQKFRKFPPLLPNLEKLSISVKFSGISFKINYVMNCFDK